MFKKNNFEITQKKMLTSVALILLLSFPIFALPMANAHTPSWTISTYAFLSVQPSPVGLGQFMFVNFWLDKVPATANGAYGDRWQNFTVKMTKPDGSTTTLGPFKSDDVGGAFTTVKADQLGTWSFVFNFPGQIMTAGVLNPYGPTSNAQSIGDYYSPATSRTTTITVTSDTVQNPPDTPLPEGYWQRPVFAENNNWYVIAGNWLGGGAGGNSGSQYNTTSNFAPYTTAPSTSHIVWTSPYAPGGIIGGEYGGDQVNSNYYATAQYEQKFAGIVINGVLYRVVEPGASTNYAGWIAQDLRTGKTIWTKDTSAWLRLGQIFDYTSPNQFGGLAYLWSVETTVAPNTGSTYGMYDAMTGKWILNIVNASSPTWAYGPTGELLGYYLDTTNMSLNMWNSTRAVLAGTTGSGDQNNWQWRPAQNASIAWKYGVQWSMPLTTTMTASNGTTVNINAYYAELAGVSQPLTISRVGQVILVTNIAGPATQFQQPGFVVAEGYSPQTGQLLWGPTSLTVPAWTRVEQSSMGGGVFTIFNYETQSFYAYSTTTGQKMWGPVSVGVASDPWGYYITQSIIAYGNVYTADFGGVVSCLDLATGAIKWTWNTGTSGYETPYGIFTIANLLAIADGKIFLMGGHLYSPPLFHGGQLYCVNASSGNLLWSTPSFAVTNRGCISIADGYVVVPNAYDNQLYCYNKGQTAATVSIQNDVISAGNTVMIKGTVTDQSPGQTSLGIPAAGTPAIADASMTAWMKYLYMQQPMPTNATGVPVTLSVFDPNNNTYTIGTTTSNKDGVFGLAWTPPVPGVYTVTATFAGSNSYYSSHAVTMFVTVPAAASPAVVPTSTPTQTTAPTSSPAQTTSASPSIAPQPTSGMPTSTYLAIGAAVIIVVAIAAALVLRRRK
jgi:hypothetical protein